MLEPTWSKDGVTFGSLFAGIGGFDLGFERAGMRCLWQVEWDQKCQDVLRRHFTAEVYDDVREVGKHNLEPVDVICGGFPCQDLSVAGKRAGLAGERSGLWFEFHRIIAELSPRWVVVENVPGLLSSSGGADFAVILSGLVELGYGVTWRVLDAQYFGVPQRRRRVFIVGSLGSGRSAEVLFEREGGAWDTAPSREAGQGVAGTIKGGSGKLGWKVNAEEAAGGQLVLAHALSASPTATGRLDQNGQDFVYHENIGGDITPDDNDAQGGHVIAFDHYNSIASEICPTLPSSFEGGFNHITIGVRRLTPVECERLQGFPDGWTAGQADSTRYRQLGNAVAVPCAEWIGKRISEAQLQMRLPI